MSKIESLGRMTKEPRKRLKKHITSTALSALAIVGSGFLIYDTFSNVEIHESVESVSMGGSSRIVYPTVYAEINKRNKLVSEMMLVGWSVVAAGRINLHEKKKERKNVGLKNEPSVSQITSSSSISPVRDIDFTPIQEFKGSWDEEWNRKMEKDLEYYIKNITRKG